MMGHKPNGNSQSLDARIAGLLGSDKVDKGELTALVAEAERAVADAQSTIETESAAALDLTNADPDASDALVRKAQRTVARLDAALPKLRDRIKSLEAFEYHERWAAAADRLEAERDALADELAELYPAFVEQLASLFERIDANTDAISRLHAAAPSVAWGQTQRRLVDAELKARSLTGYDAAHPPLRDNLRLPDWAISREVAYPPSPTIWNERARLMADAMAKQMADKFALTASADWASARELQIEQEQAETAKREAELKQAEAESSGLRKSQKEAELRRRGVATRG